MTLTKAQRIELRAACETVECYLRPLGPDLTISITPQQVEIADASWSGSSVDKSLFAALKDALTQLP